VGDRRDLGGVVGKRPARRRGGSARGEFRQTAASRTASSRQEQRVCLSFRTGGICWVSDISNPVFDLEAGSEPNSSVFLLTRFLHANRCPLRLKRSEICVNLYHAIRRFLGPFALDNGGLFGEIAPLTGHFSMSMLPSSAAKARSSGRHHHRHLGGDPDRRGGVRRGVCRRLGAGDPVRARRTSEHILQAVLFAIGRPDHGGVHPQRPAHRAVSGSAADAPASETAAAQAQTR